jgi:uncharacterized membrane protein YphA (DoxX/SURF4 family)
MNVALWIVAGLLAAVFLMAGLMKVAQPYEKLKESQAWVEDFSPGIVKAIGILEMLAAVGLVLPPLVDVAPILAPIAASGLAVTMVGAAVTHARRGGEGQMIMGNLMLLALLVFVAVGRFAIEPF